MPRPRKPKPSETPTTTPFLEALRFCALVQSDNILLNNNTAVASNNIIHCGTLIPESIYAAPNNKLLIEALSRCGEHLSITQLDNNKLSIKSDKFKAIIPCLDPVMLTPQFPDSPSHQLNNEFLSCLSTVAVLADENADDVLEASILINNQSVLACNRSVLFEAWHGLDLPTIPIPKTIIKPLIASKKVLTQFGYSPNSITFWFEDNSWIKSQQYANTWPDVSIILNTKANPFPIPQDFFIGLAAVAPFASEGWVWLKDGMLSSHSELNAGAQFEVKGIPAGPVYSLKFLSLLKPWANKIDFLASGPHSGTNMLVAHGGNVRGFVMGRGNV